MRVYELAKKLGMENRELIPELKRMGLAIVSHSNALDEATVERVLGQLGAKAKTVADRAVDKREDGRQEATTRKPGSLGRETRASARDSGKAGAAKSAAAVVEEPPKADKKRILIKRKKTDEELGAEAGDHAGLLGETAGGPGQGIAAHQAETGAPVTHEPGTHAPMSPAETVAAKAARTEREGLAHEAPPLPSGARELGTATVEPLSVARSAPGAAGESEAQRIEREKKKGIPPVLPPLEEAVGLKDKLKKVRKPGRARGSEEEIKFREDAARWQDLRAIPVHRREDRSRHSQPTAPAEITKPRKKVIKLTPGLTVKEFAELVGQRPADIIRRLMEMGQLLTLNQPMNMEAGQLIAEGLGLKAEAAAEKEGEELLQEAVEWMETERLEPRPPVVTIMGHVDHGKTSLLDAIRQTKVTEQEAGGITQHIGAYTIQVHGKPITFLDTPGHEAFTAMRARGAKITDIVVLVVAADDGVMPQTVEAINHAAAANVPILVAINKIDKPGANPERIKHSLAEHQLIPEAWGGQTIFVEVSAKQKLGLDTLLEMILLQAEVLELKADPHRPAKGVVVEAKLDRGRGPVATVLVQTGTLRTGDIFVVGPHSGRVRALITDTGEKVAEARPSMPVEVIGLPGVPAAGDQFVVVQDERVAREIAEARQRKQRLADLAAGKSRITLDDLYSRIKEGEVKELPLVIKADVQGSAEAIAEAFEKLSGAAVKPRVIHNGVGNITETDVLLASASGAIIIGFNIRPEPKTTVLAEREGVDIRLYTVIYDAIADIKAAMEGLLEPTFKERVLGRAEVRQVFSIPKVGVIGGCYVTDGVISRTSSGVRVLRDHAVIYEGKLGSLRRFKDDVREVQQGYECGIGVENFGDLKPGDILEVFILDKVAAKL